MKYLQHKLALLLLLAFFVAACGAESSTNTSATPTPVTLNVFAAASLTESFNEIKTAYQHDHPNITITYNFNGSNTLEQQIANGAADDVFASADQKNMQKASDVGLVKTSQIFAKNKLVVIVPTNNPGKIMTLKDLANKGLKIDLAAPGVPVGTYALQVLDKMGKSPEYGQAYEDSVKANAVSHETQVKAIVEKVQLGEVDAGIVYLTDVTPATASKVTEIEIPDSFNVIAQYPIAVTKSSKHASDAQAFVDYILSPAGQNVLKKYHFISVSGTAA